MVLTSTHNLFFDQEYEKYQIFWSENVHFFGVKFSVYLNRRVFVMKNRVLLITWQRAWPVLHNTVHEEHKTESAAIFLLVTCSLLPNDPFNNYSFNQLQIFITKTHLFKYIENFSSKNLKFSDKKLWYFSYFCSKHRVWVLVVIIIEPFVVFHHSVCDYLCFTMMFHWLGTKPICGPNKCL